MFERLLGKWREAEPGTEAWVLARRALESVHGADKNPFAVAIARCWATPRGRTVLAEPVRFVGAIA
ncbi:hypothetical protein ACPCIZ_33375 [Streptomyces cellulosae]|uniref:hypothetical protein n=1 Tax=Streptomyces sp. SID4956 TaxID=2690290 RepID=UPI00192914E9